MFHSLFLSLMLVFSMLFSLVLHPLALGLTLLIQTCITCLFMSMQTKTFWFSYILFLVFLGGMLVLFIYVCSLASNEKFNLSIFSALILMFMFMSSFGLFLIIDKSMVISFLNNHETSKFTIMENFLPENLLILNKLYNYPTNFLTIMLMIYLFLTLIAAVKIANKNEGPLRKSSY